MTRHRVVKACGQMPLLVIPMAGCDGQQSVFRPMGPEAEHLAALSTILFVAGGLIFVLAMTALLLALGGGARVRHWLASRHAILLGGVAFPVVVLTVLLVWTLRIADRLGAQESAAPLRIEVTARQFWWSVRYPDHDVVSANEIRVPVGRDVELRLVSTDVIHSFWVPALHGKRDMIPGHVTSLRFTAAQPGVMRGQCAEFCGIQHARMALFVVAESEDDFNLWLGRHRAGAYRPEDPFLAHGWDAFGAAGCGACHAIRGTPWSGRIGPDLTLVGGRQSLAAGTLDNHVATLAGWIADPQTLKPGNAMPAFSAVLDGQSLRALALWLSSLR